MNVKSVFSCIISAVVGTASGGMYVMNRAKKEIIKEEELSNKHLALFLMMNQWVKNEQQDKSIAKYLLAKGIRKIAVYGMSYVGETLVESLKNTGIEIMYCIDNNISGSYLGIPIIKSSENIQNVDAIIVTAITYYNGIKESIKEKINGEVISLEEIIYNI